MDRLTHAHRAGPDAPTKENAPATDRGEENKRTDSAIADASGKAFATLRAGLALQGGYSLSRSSADDGTVCFVVGRWNLTRELPDLAAVAVFLKQIGGAA